MPSTTAVYDIEQLLPIYGVFDDHVAVSKSGVYTVGWELKLPVAYTMTEDEYDDISKRFFSAVRTLPPNTIIHKQDLFLKKRYTPQHRGLTLNDDYEKMFDGVEYPCHVCYIFISMASKATFMIKSSQNRLYNRMCAIRSDKDVNIEAADNLMDDAEKFISQITDGGSITARKLDASDWLGDENHLGIVLRQMMLGSDSTITSGIGMSDEHVEIMGQTAQSFIFSNARTLPDQLSNVSAVKQLSSKNHEIFLSLTSKLGVLLDCEHVFNQYIFIPSQAAEMATLSKKQNLTTSGADSVDNEINASELEQYTRQAYTDALINVYCHCNVIAWGDPSKEKEIRNQIHNAISSMNITAVYNNYNTPELYMAAIPGNAADLSVDDLMRMEANSAIQLISLDTFDSDMKGGFLRVVDRNTLVPITIDIQQLARAKGLINNLNIFLFGPSGSGKSFTTNSIVRNHYENGNHIFIIDKGDSYEGLCAFINEQTGGKDGIYYSWDPAHPFSFNPFQNFKKWDEEDNNGYQCLISILQSLWAPKEGWKNDNVPILHKIVNEFLNLHKNDDQDPIFDDFYKFIGENIKPRILPKFDENGKILFKQDSEKFIVGYEEITPDRFDIAKFSTALSTYSLEDGMYPQVLNNRSPVNLLESRFAVFEIDKLEKQDELLYQICILCILNAFEDKMRTSRSDKMMVLEEAWKLIAKPETAEYMKGLWKTARKFHTQAMMVSQELDDVVSSDIVRDSIRENSDVQIILDQSNNEKNIDNAQRLLSLSEKDITLLLSLNKNKKGHYREIFIKWSSKKKGIYAIMGSPLERKLYESDKVLKAPLYELAEEVGSILRAAEMLVERDNQNLAS